MTQLDVYVEALEAEYKEWEAKMNLLKVKARKATAYSRVKMDRVVDKLQTQGRSARAKVDRLTRAGVQKAEADKERARQAVHEITESVNEALRDLK